MVEQLLHGWLRGDTCECHGFLDLAAYDDYTNGRLVDPQEVARAVAFLCSAESGLMTGSVIEYDQSVWGGFDGAPHPLAPL